MSTGEGLVGRLSVHKVGVFLMFFSVSNHPFDSGARVLLQGLSHDTENNCNVTHPIRLRYHRRKPGFGPRQRFWGQRFQGRRLPW